MKNDKKSNTLAIIDNYNFYDIHTDRRTWRHYDRPGPEGRVGENFSTKYVIWIIYLTVQKQVLWQLQMNPLQKLFHANFVEP